MRAFNFIFKLFVNGHLIIKSVLIRELFLNAVYNMNMHMTFKIDLNKFIGDGDISKK